MVKEGTGPSGSGRKACGRNSRRRDGNWHQTQRVRRQQITRGFAGPSEDCEGSLKSNGKALSGSEQRSVPQECGEQWEGPGEDGDPT